MEKQPHYQFQNTLNGRHITQLGVLNTTKKSLTNKFIDLSSHKIVVSIYSRSQVLLNACSINANEIIVDSVKISIAKRIAVIESSIYTAA